MNRIDELIRRVAARLGRIDGVTAVALGGSRARGTAHADSDIDLGIYYQPDQRPALSALRELAGELDDHHRADAVTDFGEWGPWINGGAWLEIDGCRVDWLFRDLQRVTHTLAECRAGRPTCEYQIGHPHGFHSHIYMGEVHHARVLHDPAGTLGALQRLTTPYPPALKRTVIDTFLFEADFSLTIAAKAATRGDVTYVSGCLFRGVACLVQALFALNERYFLNEKGAVAAADTFPIRPEGFGSCVGEILGQVGTRADQLHGSIVRLARLLETVGDLDVVESAGGRNWRKWKTVSRID